MLLRNEKVRLYNIMYGECHKLTDNLDDFVIDDIYEVSEVYETGYLINGAFFDNDSDKRSQFYWKNYFKSERDILNKKLKKLKKL